jgi:hypothetical protein
LPFTAPNKYGFVAFKIKTKPTLTLGNTVTNTADIFFDYNYPITTNTAATTIVNNVSTNEATANLFGVRLAPNPVADVLHFESSSRIEKVEIYDAAGRVVQLSSVTNNQLNVVHLPQGVYFVKIYANGVNGIKKMVKK